ncbi:hypothetical protein KUV50_13825 [Membranicola marinus]|uniref:Tetratricopeptide repeat-containing protein n=1 Tax=Membranihabitans marinus TaxID=1227546 RepID=A0A953HP81_9BACT|nr:hypothetical protein [Membranihabitans marinus]MBY5959227.1 hypothetical protein [Membranihabitans marinus]
MPISNSEQLFGLIKSLNKSEKRSFKLFASRSHNQGTSKFVRLFEILDGMEEYDEALIFQKSPQITKSQLPNLKRHLYTQIMKALRNIHIDKELDIQIREQLDFARILYGKGLYMQSLKILNRVKNIARDAHQNVLYFEILEFEKRIEEKHITRSRSIAGKMEDLIETSDYANKMINMESALTNLKLKIHGLYIKGGHAKNKDDADHVYQYFEANKPDVAYEALSFFEKVYWHQSYVWLYYILLDFENCLFHARKWAGFFHDDPMMASVNPDLYMRGMHYVMTACFHLDNEAEYWATLQSLDAFYDSNHEQFNQTSEIIYFLYSNFSKLDLASLNGRYDKNVALVPGIERRLALYAPQLDNHRVMQFYYKFAWTFFARGNYDQAINYLHKILNLNVWHLREDIQCYSWLLFILSHFEEKNFTLLTHLIKSATKFFKKMREKNKVQQILIQFVRTQLRSNQSLSQQTYQALIDELNLYTKDTYEGKALLYLDAMTWAESKLKGKTIETLMLEKSAARS